jgi:DNA-binding NtrC family response regulator
MEAQVAQAVRSECAILLIDDSIATRAPLSELLRTRGYQVFEAADADEALDLLNSRLDLDVLVTDTRVAGSMDGLALAYWVRRTRPAMHVLVICDRDAAPPLAGEQMICFTRPLLSSTLLAVLPPVATRTP